MGLYDRTYSENERQAAVQDLNVDSLFDENQIQEGAMRSFNDKRTRILYFPDNIRDNSFAFKSLSFVIIDPQSAFEKIASLVNEMLGDTSKNESNIDKNIKNEGRLFEITLPLPNVIQENNRQIYEEKTDALADLKSAINKATGSFANVFKTIIDTSASLAGANDQNQSYSQVSNFDKFKWQAFNGTQLRDFTFTYRWIPRNANEAVNMMRILYILKKYSYPSRTAKQQMLTPPAHVLLNFHNPLLHKLISPGICVIESISIDYSGGDDISMTLDGVPRRLEFSIALKEYRQKYMQDFEEKEEEK